jgi:hypothetical protein
MTLLWKRVKADQEGNSVSSGQSQEPWLRDLNFRPTLWMFSLLKGLCLRHCRKVIPCLMKRRTFDDWLRLALLCEGERAKVGRAVALQAPVVHKAAARSDFPDIPGCQRS